MKELPNNIDAERATLGSILIDPDISPLVFQVLRPDDFYDGKNKRIYNAMLQLETDAVPVDLVTVINKLRELGILEEIGGSNYLSDLMRATPTSLHVEFYARHVKDFSKLRKIVVTASQVVNVGSGVKAEGIKSILDKASTMLYNVFKDEDTSGLVDSRQLMEECWDDLERKLRNPIIAEVSTGFKELDIVTAGYCPSDLVIIAGRPSWGKSSFMTSSALHVIKTGVPCVLFPYEMSKLQTGQRFISQDSGVSLSKIKTAVGLSQAELDRVVESDSKISTLPLYIDPNKFGDIYYLAAAIRGYVARKKVKVVFIDYLQIIPTMTDDLTNEYGKITRTLKILAGALGITIVLVSQLNRGLEYRDKDDRKPKLSDLRQSGRIEEDADIVLFVYRDIQGEYPEIAEIVVGKNRNGPAGGSIGALFDQDTTRFVGKE